MKKLFFLLMIPAVISTVSCGNKNSDKKAVKTNSDSISDTSIAAYEKAKAELLKVDAGFSDYSAKNGSSEAFINYIADNGVLLRPNHKPLVGKDSISIIMNKKKKKNISMTWTPLFAEVARSGELGYTYGIYTASVPGLLGKLQIEKGTYVSIWKKDASGKWKLALDCGNEGLDQKAKQNKKQKKTVKK